MTGEVSLSLRGRQLFVVSYSRTVDGLYATNGWFQELAVDAGDHELGQAIMDGLAQTRVDVPSVLRDELDERMRPLLKRAGVRSFTRFAEGAKQISVSQEDGKISLVPSRNEGRREGFAPMPDKALITEQNAIEDHLGGLARRALERSQ